MSSQTCSITLDQLLRYRLRELEADEEETLEAHFFECVACAGRIEELLALNDGVAALARAGAVSTSVTSAVVRHAGALGMRLRTYRIAPGEQVLCTAAPEDDFVVVRLALDGERDHALDLESQVTFSQGGAGETQLIRDVAVDRESQELIYLFAGDYVRQIRRSSWVMHARVRGPDGERVLGPYTMHHVPWAELGAP